MKARVANWCSGCRSPGTEIRILNFFVRTQAPIFFCQPPISVNGPRPSPADLKRWGFPFLLAGAGGGRPENVAHRSRVDPVGRPAKQGTWVSDERLFGGRGIPALQRQTSPGAPVPSGVPGLSCEAMACRLPRTACFPRSRLADRASPRPS